MDYKSAGVDIDLADKFVERIKRMVGTTHNDRVVSGVGGFAALYRMDEKRLLAASTDGVGTKIKLAIETGVHDTIGIDLVAMCVNDLICTGARPMFFLDYFASGKLELETGVSVLKGIVEGCRQGRMALIGGETAEMPGMYASGDYDLAGFSVGEVFQQDLIDGSTVAPGQTLIGLASSGFHSNGYSLVRKLLEKNKSLMLEALTPTRIYVELIQGLTEHMGSELTGMANITGSGLLNVPRMNLSHSYDVSFMPEGSELPKAIYELTKDSGLTQAELCRTFNMGVGFVIATSNPEKAMSWLKARQEKAWVMGMVSNKEAGEVYLKGEKL
jgi:phosphoribosylformylglycinamidine cyclo-ligase